MNPVPVYHLARRRLFYQYLRGTRTAVRSCLEQRRPLTVRRRIGQYQPEESAKVPRNPLDYVTNQKQTDQRRKHIYRRMKLSGFGIAVCFGAQLLIVYGFPIDEPGTVTSGETNANGFEEKGSSASSSFIPIAKAEASDQANAKFQGKPVVVVAGGAKLVAHDERTGEETELVPTGTNTIPHFPKTIRLPGTSTTGNAEENEYTLLGLGIRSVSFLGIQVYVVGLYIQTSSLAALQAGLVKQVNPIASALIPGEKERLRETLLQGDESQAIWDKLLREKGGELKTVFRIVPVRNTDFQHLKDGWVRGITSKTRVAASKGDTEFQDDSFGEAMRDFKALFQGKGKAPKGSVVLLTRDSDGKFGCLFQKEEGKGEVEDFGKVADERIARLIWLIYLGGKNVSSEGARKSIVDGVMELVERPIGSVETKVS